MGIDLSVARLMARTQRRQPFSGSCLTFGVNGIEGQYGDVEKVFREERYPFRPLPPGEIVHDDLTQFGRSLHQQSFFRMLGCSRVDSVDYYHQEQPTYVMDLNQPVAPQFRARYDLVYDGGTLEHCFNVKEVLANAIRLLKTGGRVIHHVPMNGWADHGFYQCSPCLFFDFYRANGFDDLAGFVHLPGSRSYYLAYEPRLMDPLNHMQSRAMLWFAARKAGAPETIRDPVQSYYVQLFGSPGVPEPGGFKQKLHRWLQKHPWWYRSVHHIYRRGRIINLKRRLIRLR